MSSACIGAAREILHGIDDLLLEFVERRFVLSGKGLAEPRERQTFAPRHPQLR